MAEYCAIWRQAETERKRSGKNSVATGTGNLPFFHWRVY